MPLNLVDFFTIRCSELEGVLERMKARINKENSLEKLAYLKRTYELTEKTLGLNQRLLESVKEKGIEV